MPEKNPSTKRAKLFKTRIGHGRSGDLCMRKIAAIAALSASALGLSAGASFADYNLTILHINDWHSRIESNNKFESTCSAEEEKAKASASAAPRAW